MTIPDIINGCFESSAGLLLAMNCVRLHKDKAIKGVSLVPTSIFALWGIWNLYYYANLRQWASWYGGMLVLVSNCVWVGMAMYYRSRE